MFAYMGRAILVVSYHFNGRSAILFVLLVAVLGCGTRSTARTTAPLVSLPAETGSLLDEAVAQCKEGVNATSPVDEIEDFLRQHTRATTVTSETIFSGGGTTVTLRPFPDEGYLKFEADFEYVYIFNGTMGTIHAISPERLIVALAYELIVFDASDIGGQQLLHVGSHCEVFTYDVMFDVKVAYDKSGTPTRTVKVKHPAGHVITATETRTADQTWTGEYCVDDQPCHSFRLKTPPSQVLDREIPSFKLSTPFIDALLGL